MSTDTSVYPNSDEESESYCGSRTCTVRRTTLTSSHLPAGMSESDKEITEVISEQKLDNENLDETTAKCLTENCNPPPDDLLTSDKTEDRRLKKRPALKEVFKRMVLRRNTKKGSQTASQELEYSFPECTCRTENVDVPESELPENETEILSVIKELKDFLTENETEDPDVTEEQTSPPSSMPSTTSTKGSPATLGPSSEECGVEETMDLSMDASEETAILMELCDIVTSRFSSSEEITEHLKTSEEGVVDSGQPPTLTVARRKSLPGHSCVIL